MGERWYQPQPWIHEAGCPDAPTGLPRFMAKNALNLYPLGRPHLCFDKDTVTFNRDCVAETVTYEPHPYARSTIWPADATGPLCHTCRGTHPESALQALEHPRLPQFPLVTGPDGAGR